jgi:hypothetical protein
MKIDKAPTSTIFVLLGARRQDFSPTLNSNQRGFINERFLLAASLLPKRIRRIYGERIRD